MVEESLRRGVVLFNQADFFDAHEVFEDLWRSVPRSLPASQHIQGMVQLAVAFHHQSHGNMIGAGSVLERAIRNLHGAEGSLPELEFDPLFSELKLWQEYLSDSQIASERRNSKQNSALRKIDKQPPALPQIKWRT